MNKIFCDKSLWTFALLTALAVLIQIQSNFFQSESYTGLRIALSDIIIPFAGIGILTSILLKKSYWPNWRVPYVYLWLGGLFLILCFATYNTYRLYDIWSTWALTNKVLGFATMAAYFGLGGWLSTNLKEEDLRRFLQVVAGFFFAFLFLGALCMTAVAIYPPSNRFFYDTIFSYPMEGLMANRNAYALFALINICFLISYDFKSTPLFSEKITRIIFFLLPFGLIDVGSRASFLALLVLFILLGIFHRKQTLKFILPFLIGVIALIGLYAHKPSKLGFYRDYPPAMVQKIIEVNDLSDTHTLQDKTAIALNQGDRNRFEILEVARSVFKNNEIFGAGLGAALHKQKEVTGKFETMLDSTPLWLLIETGIFGLSAFLAFFFLCLKQLWKGRKHHSTFRSALSYAMFLGLLCYAVMCFFHEMTYTRQIWFFLGIALALPVYKQNP